VQRVSSDIVQLAPICSIEQDQSSIIAACVTRLSGYSRALSASRRTQPHANTAMGLDGGTYITRTDVLRGQSWAYTQADSTRSTRGGAAGASTVYRPRQMDQQTERWACSVVTSHQQCRAMSVCSSIPPFQLRRSRGKCPLRLAQSALIAAYPVHSSPIPGRLATPGARCA